MSELTEFISLYWTSLLPLAVLASIYLSIGFFALAFQIRKSNSRLRAKLLTWVFTLNIMGWSFVAISFALCGLLAGTLVGDYAMLIRNIVGGAFSASLIIALPISFFAKRRASETVLGRLPGKVRASGELDQNFQKLASKMNVSRVRLYLADLPAPISMATSGKNNIVMVARGLVKILTEQELTAVLAHELAHIRNGDSALKTLAVVYRKFLPIDPVIRLLEPAIHREREFFADEVSATTTRHPLHLASALIKIHESYSSDVSLGIAGLSIMGGSKGFLSKHPPLKERVERLLQMSSLMSE